MFPPKYPTTDAPVGATRPLFFEYFDGEKTGYSMSGTGFLVVVDDLLLFVTARHAVANGHEELRVPVELGREKLVPLKERYDAFEHIGERPEPIDVTFFTLAPETAEEEQLLRAMALQTLRGATFGAFLQIWWDKGLDPTGIPLCAYGYPKSDQEVFPALVSRNRLGKMRFKGRSPLTESYEAEWDTQLVPLPDGMSGSPVFIRGRFWNGGDHVLVGILTNASGGIAHFMCAGLLVQLARQALRTVKQTPSKQQDFAVSPLRPAIP